MGLSLETLTERPRLTDDTHTPRPTGRPRIAQDERRTDGLRVRMTAGERASVEARAAQAGLPVSEFARRAVFGAPIIDRTAATRSGIPHGLLSELARVGNNLNQIAHAAHLGRELRRMAEASLIDLRALMDAIAARLDDDA